MTTEPEPILHRMDAFVPATHPAFDKFRALTEAEESAASRQMVRFALGRPTTTAEIGATVEAVARAAGTLRPQV